jgi:hypothetical protein
MTEMDSYFIEQQCSAAWLLSVECEYVYICMELNVAFLRALTLNMNGGTTDGYFWLFSSR